MTTITVEKVPQSIVKKYWTNIDYKAYNKYILKDKMTAIKNVFYDPKNDSYWPFEWEQAISFLKLLDHNEKEV